MKPLIALVSFFVLLLACMKLFGWWGKSYSYAGVFSMTMMLFFTSLGHFKYASGMELMLPPVVPYRKQLVYITGFLEIFMAIGLTFVSAEWTRTTGWFLIIFLILSLPANIYAAFKHVDYERANFEGPGPSYLWFRIPLQVFFICWVYFFAVRPSFSHYLPI